MTLNEFLKEYAETYAFGTVLRYAELLTPHTPTQPGDEILYEYKAIAINLGTDEIEDFFRRKVCLSCSGTGLLYTLTGRDRICHHCSGTGLANSKVFDSVWRRECWNCLGEGKFRDNDLHESSYCGPCSGTGYLEPYDLMLTFVRMPNCIGDDHGHFDTPAWDVKIYSTKEDVDCGAICKSFGGSGSRHEGRFQCRELPFEY